ncbi:MAG TPA: hypothetical protein VE987_08165 [Polyangiaceae bacterium]|nr:hypothetical protein [Polyangiaceae bacterium]
MPDDTANSGVTSGNAAAPNAPSAGLAANPSGVTQTVAPSGAGAVNIPVGAAPGVGGQSPSIFGTGQFTPVGFPINDQAITGAPAQGAAANYGLNDVSANLQNALSALGVRNYSAGAPQAVAAQGTAAAGQAAQAQAALGSASGYTAATGGPSSIGQVAGRAATGNAALAGPTAISTAGDASMLAQQQQLANILGVQAAGGGVSPADLQLRAGMDQQVNAQLAALGSQRGSSNYALAQRSAADQAAGAEQALNAQMGIQRAQETLSAQQALGNVLGTARGQSQNYNLTQAQLLQSLGLANAGALNNMTQFNAGALNNMTAENLGLAQQSNEFNAGNAQQMMLANLGAQNAASQFNAGNAQAMTLANQMAENQMTGANLGAQNQFGMANVENAQQTGLANLANAQQTSLANLGTAGQFGLANQQAAIAAQNQYNQQLMALLGAQTGIGQSNRAASLADQQLQVQQQIALNEIAAQQFMAAAQANANLTGAVIGGVAAGGSALLNAFGGGSSSGGGASAGATTVDPSTGLQVTGPSYALSTPISPLTLSDENVKAGVEGGNPMLRSFLEQYRDAMSKDDPRIDVESGLQFRGPRYARSSGAMAGGDPNAAAGAGLGAVLGMFGPIGGAIGRAAGPALSSAMMGSGGPAPASSGGGASGPMVDPGGGIQSIGVPEDEASAVSDDQAKENVISGNRGMQAFLEQANAQQQAAARQGSASNAFMQIGQAPSAQIDRQLPPWLGGSPGAGYGFSQYGGAAGGGLSSLGGVASAGGFTPGATQNPGAVSSGGLTQQAAVTRAPSMTSQGGVSSPGGVSIPSPTPPPSAQPFLAPTFVTPANGEQSGAAGAAILGALNPPASAQPPPAFAPGFATPANSAPTGAAGSTLLSALSAPAPAAAAPFAPMRPTGSMLVRGLAVSDEGAKADIAEMMDHLHAHSYRYKDPDAAGAGPGRYVSPMAQEFQKSPLGARAVSTGPDGDLVVNYGHLLGAQWGALAMLNERQDNLESLLRSTTSQRSRSGADAR